MPIGSLEIGFFVKWYINLRGLSYAKLSLLKNSRGTVQPIAGGYKWVYTFSKSESERNCLTRVRTHDDSAVQHANHNATGILHNFGTIRFSHNSCIN